MRVEVINFGIEVAALIGVIGLILGAARIARRRLPGAAGAGRRLRIAETIALDPRRRLHLLECDGRPVLLLTGGGGDILLRLHGDDEPHS